MHKYIPVWVLYHLGNYACVPQPWQIFIQVFLRCFTKLTDVVFVMSWYHLITLSTLPFATTPFDECLRKRFSLPKWNCPVKKNFGAIAVIAPFSMLFKWMLFDYAVARFVYYIQRLAVRWALCCVNPDPCLSLATGRASSHSLGPTFQPTSVLMNKPFQNLFFKIASSKRFRSISLI